VTRAGSDSISTCDGGLVTVYRAPPLPFSQCALSQVVVLIWVSALLEATAVFPHRQSTVGKGKCKYKVSALQIYQGEKVQKTSHM